MMWYRAFMMVTGKLTSDMDMAASNTQMATYLLEISPTTRGVEQVVSATTLRAFTKASGKTTCQMVREN